MGNDFFTNLTNFNVTSLEKEEKENTKDSAQSLYYSPSTYMRELGLSTYNSLIRFIPYYKNPEKSILSKYVSWIYNNKREQRRKIDDTPFLHRKPRLIGDCFFACWDEKNNSALYELRSRFNSNEEHTCMIQVIDDEQKPELVGKIMLFQFKKKVYGKLYDARFPSSKHQESHNPFLLEARGFSVDLHQTTLEDGLKKFPNYDNCKFIDKMFGIVDSNGDRIEDKDVIKSMLTDETIIKEFERNEFKEWDEDTKKFVAESIISVFPDCAALQKIKNKYADIFVLLDDEPTPVQTPAPKVEPKVEKPKPQPKKEEKTFEEITNDEDEFNLDDFDVDF